MVGEGARGSGTLEGRRVLLVSHEATLTGAPRVGLHLIRALNAGGWRTSLVHRWGGPLRPELDRAAARSRLEPASHLRVVLRRWRITKPLANRVQRWAIRRVLLDEAPDLVWCNTVVSAVYAPVAVAMGIPCVVYSHEQPELLQPALDRVGLSGRRRGRLGSEIQWIACSTQGAEALAESAGIGVDRVAVLHSPVDVDAIERAATTGAVDAARSPLVVGCGRGNLVKGIDVFIDAASIGQGEGTDATWCWVGNVDGFQPDQNVLFTGEVEDASPWIGAADVFVMCSRSETFPLVVLEAMALRRPIVASRLPGVLEQLGDTGVLVEPGDPAALHAAVRDLLEHPDRGRRLGAAAGLRCRESWDIGRFNERVNALAVAAVDRAAIPHWSNRDARSTRPVRVAHVLWRLSRGGGVQTVVRQIAAHSDPAAVDLHVVSARPPRVEDGLDDVPLHFHSLGVGFDDHFGAAARVRLVWSVARELRRIRPAVVHLHSGTAWMGFLASAALPTSSFLLEVHDAPGSGRHSRWTDLAEGWWTRIRRATVVCHSRSVERQTLMRWHVNPRRVNRFPLAVELSAFSGAIDPTTRSRWRSAHGIPGDQFVVLAVGRLAPSKRVDLVIEATARLVAEGHDIGLVLVGSGSQADVLREQARRLDVSDRVLFLGPVSDDDLVAAFAASDVLVSASDYEGFGLTLVEAMAAGLPTVATSVGGVADVVIDSQTGYLVEPDDVGALVRALSELIADPELGRRLGDAGRRRAEACFDAALAGARFQSLYLRLAGRSRRRRLPWSRSGG